VSHYAQLKLHYWDCSWPGEHSCWQGSMRTESCVCYFIHLMIQGTVHRLSSDSLHCKPCFSFYSPLMLLGILKLV
jgi:hypothetical protein